MQSAIFNNFDGQEKAMVLAKKNTKTMNIEIPYLVPIVVFFVYLKKIRNPWITERNTPM